MADPYLLPVDTTLDAAGRVVAVLPVGSLEQHGPYLPLITDTVVACTVAAAIARVHPVRVLPPVTISCSHEHAAWPGTVSISARTLYSVVEDIASSLRRAGVPNLVLLNGHGGNYVLSNVAQETEGVALFPTGADWAHARARAGLETSSRADMHAGELETSVLLHAHPTLVKPDYETADHDAEDRPHLLTRGLHLYTESGVVGRPSLASARKGEAVVAGLVEAFGWCLAALPGQ
ncbi:creatininase family protein [Actinosynnema sp. NPDC020468]|uniref:creatininase family protein n=1 Tax=Actinosynnema sp. NPDC020468 TaxID=3154488 RepID=UPI0033EC7064